MAEGHVLDALDDQAGGLAALAKVDQLVELPVPEAAAEVGWRVELDARQAELLGEGGDRVVEPFDVSEGETHGHLSSAGEPVRWPATSAGPAREQPAGVWLVRLAPGRELLLGGRDEQQVEVRSTERAAGHLSRRNLDP